MHYYVDGYNLLFRNFLHDADLKSQREQFIKEINAKIDIVKIDISLVFDASFMPGEATVAHYKHLEILYTAYGEIADDFIVSKLKTECPLPQQVVVVTSDKRLAWRAKCAGALVQSIEEFLSWLNKSYKSKLRHKKIEKSDVIAPITTHKKPSEGSLEYYLHAFETRYEILAEAQRLQKKNKNK